MVLEGDVLILYGRATAIKHLNERKRGYEGKIEHVQAVDQHKAIDEQEKQSDTLAQEKEK